MAIIRVLIVETQGFLRLGLESILREDKELELVGVTTSGEQALCLARQHQPHVVMLDLILAGTINGFELITHFKRLLSGIRVLIVTSLVQRKLIRRALRAGVAGYLPKDVNGAELSWAIKATQERSIILTPHLTDLVAGKLPVEVRTIHPSGMLGVWELEILRLVARGKSSREIAQVLAVEELTARKHLRNILTKLNLPTWPQALVYAHNHNLIEGEKSLEGDLTGSRTEASPRLSRKSSAQL